MRHSHRHDRCGRSFRDLRPGYECWKARSSSRETGRVHSVVPDIVCSCTPLCAGNGHVVKGINNWATEEYWQVESPDALWPAVAEGQTTTVEFKVRKIPASVMAPANRQPETHPATRPSNKKGELPPPPKANDPSGKTSAAKSADESSPATDPTAKKEGAKPESNAGPAHGLMAEPNTEQVGYEPRSEKLKLSEGAVKELEVRLKETSESRLRPRQVKPPVPEDVDKGMLLDGRSLPQGLDQNFNS